MREGAVCIFERMEQQLHLARRQRLHGLLLRHYQAGQAVAGLAAYA
jgi:hypothetical protein